jgi:hypothetical protein
VPASEAFRFMEITARNSAMSSALQFVTLGFEKMWCNRSLHALRSIGDSIGVRIEVAAPEAIEETNLESRENRNTTRFGRKFKQVLLREKL